MNSIRYNVSGSDRKQLVGVIAHELNTHAKYLGMPSMTYQIGDLTIDAEGTVSWTADTPQETISRAAHAAEEAGFRAEEEPTCAEADDAPAEASIEASAETDNAGLTISLPIDGFSEQALANLRKLLSVKGSLIRKALGADRMTVETAEDRVSFLWWDSMPKPEEVQAYMSFIAALCAMAKDAKRVTAKEKDVESEKYAFRGFLLRLGFIGDASKAQRKILLKNLSGSAAFPDKAKADAFSATQKEKRDAAKEVSGDAVSE